MINTDSVFSQLLFSTIRIMANNANGQTFSTGTAFFVQFNANKEQIMPVLVTNKHVIAGAASITFLVHEADQDNKPTERSFPITLKDDANRWIYHPDNAIDLCILPCGPLIYAVNMLGRKMFFRGISEDLIPTQEILENLLPIEDVIIVGSPLGMWDDLNNFPLFRRGITASHPALDFNQQSIGIADIAVFPGSSGSPLFIANTSSYGTADGSVVFGSRLLFLGIIYAVQLHQLDGRISIIQVPTAQTAVLQSKMPAHLGVYIKSKELLVLKKIAFETFGVH